ncbi:VWA domain-containing protein [bacterium CPR1]|nr:VWA domain-containing protein [bacterium CPR1]
MAYEDGLVRWRLVLGEAAQPQLGCCALGGEEGACDAALSWLYDRDPGLKTRDIMGGRKGGQEAPQLSVADWINQVHTLFPRETIERLEKDAVERFEIDEVVTNPEVLKRVQPNQTLLQAVLKTRHLMNPEVLELARELVRKVVEELMEKLASEVQKSFSGPRRNARSSPFKLSRDLDLERTVRANLKHYDPETRKLYLEKAYFFQRSRRHRAAWQLILLVDQSGSMLGSVIHSAITAACFWSVPMLKTHLAVFSTEVVDLTADCTDPVELLMKVQLGGGTDIARAMDYAAGLVENPRRTIIALITDFFEGGDAPRLVRTVRGLCEQGTTVLGLAALDEGAEPIYDRELAGRLVDVGAHVGAMTPGQLAAWIGERVSA